MMRDSGKALMAMGFSAGLMVAAGPAAAALQCNYYDDLVAAAVMVLQIDNTTVLPPDASSNCTVVGDVARVFRGDMEVGTRVQTRVPCDNINMEVGAGVFRDSEALAAAPVIELHIAPEGGPAGYGAGVVMLEALTDAPAYIPMCER